MALIQFLKHMCQSIVATNIPRNKIRVKNNAPSWRVSWSTRNLHVGYYIRIQILSYFIMITIAAAISVFYSGDWTGEMLNQRASIDKAMEFYIFGIGTFS